jgi:hypothetical protein
MNPCRACGENHSSHTEITIEIHPKPKKQSNSQAISW